MRPRPTIKNMTTVNFDICKACTASEVLYPGQSATFLTTVRSFCNGHSSCGSFLIARYGDNHFEYRTWGNIALTLHTINGHSTFVITEV